MVKNAGEVLYNMETDLLEQIIKLLKSGTDKGIETAKWKLEKLKQMGKLKKVTSKLIKENILEAIQIAEKEIIEAGILHKDNIDNALNKALPETADERLKSIWSIYERKARDELLRLGAKLMRKVDEAMIDIIETSTAKVLAGQATLRNAIKETSKKWIDNGFKPMTDAAGRNWSTEGYSQMVIRSQIRNTVTETQFERFKQHDIELVEISSHIGARPLCEPYQGKVFSLTGTDEKYPNLYLETSYGEPAGLFGINCGHVMYPFIDGMEQTYSPYPFKKNEQYYKESQQQRYYERKIRQYKRQDKLEGTDHSGKIKQYENAIDDLGRTRRKDRETIYN